MKIESWGSAGWFDELIAWMTAFVVILLAVWLKPQKDGVVKSERWCRSCSRGLIELSTSIAAVLLFGWFFLVLLQIESAFWPIWQLFFLMSRVLIVRALPVCIFVVLFWALVGRWIKGYQARTIWLSLVSLGALGLNILLLRLFD